MLRIHGPSLFMAKKYNMPRQMNHLHSTKLTHNVFNPSLVHSSTMLVLSIPPSSLPSTRLPVNKLLQPTKLAMPATTFLTTSRHIHLLPFATMQAAWSSAWFPMLPISFFPKPVVDVRLFTLSPTHPLVLLLAPLRTVPFMSSSKPSMAFRRQHPKLKLQVSSVAAKKPVPSSPHFRKWVIRNLLPAHRSKPTIPLHTIFSKPKLA
mmetsp:Transcript_21640/g.31591  ORF Transcript_21640/g.31591 Transcript_21640/m.31591 type:complete len:206 (+) Transcript_21640:137-754(+)